MDGASQGSDGQRGRKRYHRHTPRQIQRLEQVFKQCQHPDENMRAELSRELGLDPRQIKFWFQNRRTQLKVQTERADNSTLRAENERIRMENTAMEEALKNTLCPNCSSGLPAAEGVVGDTQMLRAENARLKELLNRITTLTAKQLGLPVTQITNIPVSTTSTTTDQPTVGGGMPAEPDMVGGGGGSSSGNIGTAETQIEIRAAMKDLERSMMMDKAVRAMDELIRLAGAGDVWLRGDDGRETLDVAVYDGIFTVPAAGFRLPNTIVEGSRDSRTVFMSAIALVDLFMDANKWMDFFPGIVSKAYTVDVLVNAFSAEGNESLIMMYEEMHLMTPLVLPRESNFLRYCKQLEQGIWAVVDVTVDASHYGIPTPPCRRQPSGCIISDLANGYSKVTWVEHVYIDQMPPIKAPFPNLVLTGAAFGAHRWLGALQSACDRFASLAMLGSPDPNPTGVTPEGRRSLMKLSQRMMHSFGATMIFSRAQQWTVLDDGAPEVSIRAAAHDGAQPGQPVGVVLTAAISVWLPVPCAQVSAFLCDDSRRSEWDVLTIADQHMEVARINKGADPGNCISLFQSQYSSQTNTATLIVQESSTDAWGSTVVYSAIDLTAANMVMCGADTSSIVLLPSGFSILPDAHPPPPAAGASSSSAPPQGCVLTAAFQIVDPNLTSTADVNGNSVTTVKKLAVATVEQIRAALSNNNNSSSSNSAAGGP